MDLSKLNKKFPNKRAIITGANSGVGFEILQILSLNDWQILAIDLNISNLEKINNDKIQFQKVDITHRDLFKKAISDFCNINKGLDIIFNNAGVGEGVRFKDYPLEDWDWIIDINLKSVIAGCYYAFDEMQKQNKGLIVNMASAAGYANLPNMSPYNVTKSGVISLSETLAHEFSSYGIQVMCVTPTFFQSNILAQSRGTSDVLASATRVVKKSKLDSKDAARIIVSQLHKNKETLKFPFSAKAIYLVKKFFPKLYVWAVRKYLVK
ncbi:MAG: hypothetical protein CMO01_16840 [Thalassobius sp.]|nr:hypothetical protein [Thalassovita sp.]